MKTAILTAALMIVMTVSFAEVKPDTLSNTSKNEKNFKVWVINPADMTLQFNVSNPDNDKVVLKIYNDEMAKIFHRTVKNEKEASVSADLSKLGTGTYTYVVERNGKEEVRKTINLN